MSAMKSAQAGMRRQAEAFDSAVAKVTNATLEADQPEAPPTGPMPRPASASDQLLTGFTDMMIAQRMFMANLRAAAVADEILEVAAKIGE